jgi:hypothetical protein
LTNWLADTDLEDNIQCVGEFDLNQDMFFLDLYAVGQYNDKWQDDMGEVLHDELYYFDEDPDSDMGLNDGIPMTLNPDYSLAAGLLMHQDGEVSYSVAWNEIAVSHPPDPNAAR